MFIRALITLGADTALPEMTHTGAMIGSEKDWELVGLIGLWVE